MNFKVLAMETEEYKNEITSFLDGYFEDIETITEFNFQFVTKHNFEISKIEYIKLMRFFQTAMDKLKSIDTKIYSGIVGKLFNDCQRLYEFHSEFLKQNKNSTIIYHMNFLPTIDEYSQLKSTSSSLLSQETILKNNINVSNAKMTLLESENNQNSAQYKNAKKLNIDSVNKHQMVKQKNVELIKKIKDIEFNLQNTFTEVFESRVLIHSNELAKYINTKMMFLDKLITANASKSNSIKAFFKNANIDGEYKIKNFIKYYMKNINVSKVKSNDWHSYLEECLQILE
jgi:hypothetical protein